MKTLREKGNIFVPQILEILKPHAEFILKYFGVSLYIRNRFFYYFISGYFHLQNLFWLKQYFVEGNGIQKIRKYSFTSERTQQLPEKCFRLKIAL